MNLDKIIHEVLLEVEAKKSKQRVPRYWRHSRIAAITVDEIDWDYMQTNLENAKDAVDNLNYDEAVNYFDNLGGQAFTAKTACEEKVSESEE